MKTKEKAREKAKKEANIDIDNMAFDCACPKCAHDTAKTAGFIRKYSHYVCAGCNSIVPVVDRTEILKALAVGEKVIELSRVIGKRDSAA
jgi:transposase-like protein